MSAYNTHTLAEELMRESSKSAALRSRVRKLEAALTGMLNHYVALVESGDAGFWNADEEPEVIAARAALANATNREDHMVVVSRKPDGTPDVWCDPEIADLVHALNGGGVRTVASCSGHGERPGNIALADGRELIIAANFAEARRIEQKA